MTESDPEVGSLSWFVEASPDQLRASLGVSVLPMRKQAWANVDGYSFFLLPQSFGSSILLSEYGSCMIPEILINDLRRSTGQVRSISWDLLTSNAIVVSCIEDGKLVTRSEIIFSEPNGSEIGHDSISDIDTFSRTLNWNHPVMLIALEILERLELDAAAERLPSWFCPKAGSSQALSASSQSSAADLPGGKSCRLVEDGNVDEGAEQKLGTVWQWAQRDTVLATLEPAFCASSDSPYPLDGLTHIDAITAVADTAVALDIHGAMFVWGKLDMLLPNAEWEQVRAPSTQVPILCTGVPQAARVIRSTLIDTLGNPWDWLGVGSVRAKDNREGTFPHLIKGLSNIVDCAWPLGFRMALSADGSLWCWSNHEPGEDEKKYRLSSASVFTSIAGPYAVDETGSVWQVKVDRNFDGNISSTIEYERVGGLQNIVKVFASHDSDFFFALSSDGEVYAWGSNVSGQLGCGSARKVNRPVRIEGLDPVSDVAAGGSCAFALSRRGEVFGWGTGLFTRSKIVVSRRPVHMGVVSGATRIEASYSAALVLR